MVGRILKSSLWDWNMYMGGWRAKRRIQTKASNCVNVLCVIASLAIVFATLQSGLHAATTLPRLRLLSSVIYVLGQHCSRAQLFLPYGAL